jgi:aldose sugar dehydrogenase
MRLRPLMLLAALGLVSVPLVNRFAGPVMFGSNAASPPGAPTFPGQTRAPAPARNVAVQTEQIAKGLEHPWGLQFLGGGRMLVTERPGRLRVIDASGTLSPPISGLPPVAAIGQGGLLDVVLDPKFAENGLIYWTYAEPRGALRGTSVARGKLILDTSSGNTTGRLDDVRVIFRQDSATTDLHFGSRLVFGRDGLLFVALGERNLKAPAQDMSSTHGKIVRIAPDGGVPPTNPFVGRDGIKPEIWSSGHRNIQAAALHPVTGKLWAIEHGPRGGDEINVPLAGKNYGWPVIGYGIDYSGAKIHDATSRPGMEQPVYYWTPSIAPSGMAFYTGNAPEWAGNLFVGALAGQHVSRLVLDGERVIGEEKLLVDLGERIRDVRMSPDGALYLLTDNPQGRVLRMRPKVQ